MTLAAVAIEEIREQVRYRELLYQMTLRDLRLRYKQTVMGFGWAVFLPLTHTIIFSIIFTRVAQVDTGVPYPVYAFCGLLPWTFFASSLRFSATSLTSNSALVAKVYFPREIFPTSIVLVALVDFLVAGTVLAGLLVYYDIGVSGTLWLLPALILLHAAFTLGLSLMIAMANLFYRDVKYLMDVLLTVWMFATPVVFPVDRIGGTIGAVLAWNPMTPIIRAYRDIILSGTAPSPTAFLLLAAGSILTLVAGWCVFHRSEPRFAESL